MNPPVLKLTGSPFFRKKFYIVVTTDLKMEDTDVDLDKKKCSIGKIVAKKIWNNAFLIIFKTTTASFEF